LRSPGFSSKPWNPINFTSLLWFSSFILDKCLDSAPKYMPSALRGPTGTPRHILQGEKPAHQQEAVTNMQELLVNKSPFSGKLKTRLGLGSVVGLKSLSRNGWRLLEYPAVSIQKEYGITITFARGSRGHGSVTFGFSWVGPEMPSLCKVLSSSGQGFQKAPVTPGGCIQQWTCTWGDYRHPK
jgi:hypothetical protein